MPQKKKMINLWLIFGPVSWSLVTHTLIYHISFTFLFDLCYIYWWFTMVLLMIFDLLDWSCAIFPPFPPQLIPGMFSLFQPCLVWFGVGMNWAAAAGLGQSWHQANWCKVGISPTAATSSCHFLQARIDRYAGTQVSLNNLKGHTENDVHSVNIIDIQLIIIKNSIVCKPTNCILGKYMYYTNISIFKRVNCYLFIISKL